jgi:hypothetical protein
VNAINPPNIIKTIAPVVDFALGLAADFEVVEELGFPVVRSSSKVKQFRIERIPELLAHRIIYNPHQSRIINNETLHRRRVPNRPSIQAPIWSAIRSHRIPRRYYTLA